MKCLSRRPEHSALQPPRSRPRGLPPKVCHPTGRTAAPFQSHDGHRAAAGKGKGEMAGSSVRLSLWLSFSPPLAGRCHYHHGHGALFPLRPPRLVQRRGVRAACYDMPAGVAVARGGQSLVFSAHPILFSSPCSHVPAGEPRPPHGYVTLPPVCRPAPALEPPPPWFRLRLLRHAPIVLRVGPASIYCRRVGWSNPAAGQAGGRAGGRGQHASPSYACWF